MNIILSFLFGYLSADRPFTYQLYGLIGVVIASTYSVLVLLRTFPAQADFSYMTDLHVSVVALATELL
jgi:hypothetical protein